MPTKIEGRAPRHDVIDDIVEAPSAASFHSNSVSSFMMDGVKAVPARSFSSYSNIPTLFNNKSKSEQTESSARPTVLTDELRDRLNLTLPRSNSSSTMRNNDERRKELDIVLKHLYDGKLLTSLNDDRASSDVSDHSIPILSKGPTNNTLAMRADEDNKTTAENLDVSLITREHSSNNYESTACKDMVAMLLSGCDLEDQHFSFEDENVGQLSISLDVPERWAFCSQPDLRTSERHPF